MTPEALKEAGLIDSLRKDVKVLGDGELTKALTVTAHRFSASAREKIEAAGGTATALVEPKPKKAKKARSKPVTDDADESVEASAESEPEAEETDEPAAEEPAED